MPDKSKKEKSEILMPLKQFSLNGPYRLSWLYHLARDKKIKVIKIGQVYYTTLNWFNNYLLKAGNGRKEKRIITENKLSQVLEKYLAGTADDEKSLDQIDIDEKLLMEWREVFKSINSEYFDKAIKTKEKKRKYWLNYFQKLRTGRLNIRWLAFFLKQKVEAARQETLEKLSPRPWAIKLVAACLAALIFSFSMGRLTPKTANNLAERADRVVFYPFNKVSQLAGKNDATIIQAFLNKNQVFKLPENYSSLSSYIKNHQIELKGLTPGKAYAISMQGQEGQVAGVASKADKGAETDGRLSITDFIKQKSSQVVKTVSSYAKNIFNKIANKQKQLSLKLDRKLSDLLAD